MWKLIAAATSGAALATLVVVLCLGGNEKAEEFGSAETTGGALPRPPVAPTAPPRATEPSPEPEATHPPGLGPKPMARTAPSEAHGERSAPPAEVETSEDVARADARRELELAVLDGPEPPAQPAEQPAQPAEQPAQPAEQLPQQAEPPAPPRMAIVGSNPLSPPMSAGAGPFTTEAPPYAASTFVPNPNAGAGPFTTEPPPYAASALTGPDPNAGAGAFTTEWRVGTPLGSYVPSALEAAEAEPVGQTPEPTAMAPAILPIVITPIGLPVPPAGVPAATGAGVLAPPSAWPGTTTAAFAGGASPITPIAQGGWMPAP